MISIVEEIKQHLREALAPCTATVWIAYSGGMDSHVLLDAVSALQIELPKDIRAIHIHHGLHPLADSWAIHCQTTCAALSIPCEVIRVQVTTGNGESLEAQARLARYAALQTRLKTQDSVLTAQHQDDQAETLLLQLFRGAGVAGLAAMPAVSRLGAGWLLRPLLQVTRQQLQNYAIQRNLQWIEDDSNQSLRFDRNFLRHQIMPLLQQRWQPLSALLSRTARHQAEAQDLLTELAHQDLTYCRSKQFSNAISLVELNTLSAARQRNLVRTWLKQRHLPVPSTLRLQEILDTMWHAQPDKQPCLRWAGVEVRRYQHCLFAFASLPASGNFATMTWDLRLPITLPLGTLRAEWQRGRGVRLPALTCLQIRWRRGGERCRWHGHQRDLKKLLQQALIPPWLRPFLPLLYVDDTLVAIPNMMICDNFTVDADEMGWVIHWEIADQG